MNKPRRVWVNRGECSSVAANYGAQYPWYCYSVVQFDNKWSIIITDSENVIGWLDTYNQEPKQPRRKG